MTVWLHFHGKNADKSVEWPWHNPLKKNCSMPFEIFVSPLLSYIPRLIFHNLLALTKFGGFIMIVINDKKIAGLLTPYKDSSSEAQSFWQNRARK